jgi:hypothetical protein
VLEEFAEGPLGGRHAVDVPKATSVGTRRTQRSASSSSYPPRETCVRWRAKVRKSVRATRRECGVATLRSMCKNIQTLHNFDPPATDEEVRAAALQYVRKVSGSNKPSRANAEAFDRACEEVAAATRRLLDGLVAAAPPKNREVEAARRRARAQARFAA